MLLAQSSSSRPLLPSHLLEKYFNLMASECALRRRCVLCSAQALPLHAVDWNKGEESAVSDHKQQATATFTVLEAVPSPWSLSALERRCPSSAFPCSNRPARFD